MIAMMEATYAGTPATIDKLGGIPPPPPFPVCGAIVWLLPSYYIFTQFYIHWCKLQSQPQIYTTEYLFERKLCIPRNSFSTPPAMATLRSLRSKGLSKQYIQNHFLHVTGTTTVECKTGYGLETAAELRLLKVLQRAKQELPIEISITYCGAHAVPK